MYSTNFIPQGWECPKCKRVYSPTTTMCAHCPEHKQGITSSGTGTINTLSVHTFERDGTSDICKKCGKSYLNHHIISNTTYNTPISNIDTFNNTSSGTMRTHNFESDKKSTSKTKCKICGLEKWQHPNISHT
jgi:hypothetical protein